MAMPAKKPKPTAKKTVAKKATVKKAAAKTKPKGKTEDQLWGPAKRMPKTDAEKRAAIAKRRARGECIEPAKLPGFAFGKKTN